MAFGKVEKTRAVGLHTTGKTNLGLLLPGDNSKGKVTSKSLGDT